MSEPEKLEIFGELFVNDPKSFRFLPGETYSIPAAAQVASHLLEQFALEYTYEKVVPGKKRKGAASQNLKSAKTARVTERAEETSPAENTLRPASSTSGTGSHASRESTRSDKVIRKGKTLSGYTENWLRHTKWKPLFSFTNCRVDDVACTITCLICNVKPFNGNVDANGGWKISSFQHHVKMIHSCHGATSGM